MAVSQEAMTLLEMSLDVMLRNMLIRLQVPSGSGYLVMPSPGTLPDLLLVKSKIIFSGSSGSVEVTIMVLMCCHHGFLVCSLVHICQ